MKNRDLLLITFTLLLMCALIPLQRATALTAGYVSDKELTTITTDTDDITFTIRLTSEAGENRNLLILVSASILSTDAALPTVLPVPKDLLINGAGTHDVTYTIPRTAIPTTRDRIHAVFTIGDNLDTTFRLLVPVTLHIYLPGDKIVDNVDINVVGSLVQSLGIGESGDATFTMRVTNKSDDLSLVVKCQAIDFEKESDDRITNPLDVTLIRFSPVLLVIEPNGSKKVTLTVPRHLLTELGSYVINVFAVPAVGSKRPSVTLTINVGSEAGVLLEVLGDSTQTTTMDDTDDVAYTLRVTNIGHSLDRINFTISDPYANSTKVDPNELLLFPDSFEDITLTIPRTVFTGSGTYEILVTSHSYNNPNKKSAALTETVVTGDTPKIDDTIYSLTPIVFFSEFMFESEGEETSLPQWIEVYNSSSFTVNLQGWRLQLKRLQPSLLEVTTTFKEDFFIPPQQSKLIVTTLGRRSGSINLSDDFVYPLGVLHAQELSENDITNHNHLMSRGGFSLKLIASNNKLIDEIGTLENGVQTWELPECLIDGDRSSLIRRFDSGEPRAGIERRGWIRAVDTKNLVAGIYYGNPQDLGTPGYRRGKPLPVELSQFSAKFVRDEVVINWTTESELNNAGFNILRSTSRAKNFHRINAKLIEGAGTTGQRNTYQFIDKTAKSDVAYYYRLEDVDLSGTRVIRTSYRLRGVIAPIDKLMTTWGALKDNR